MKKLLHALGMIGKYYLYGFAFQLLFINLMNAAPTKGQSSFNLKEVRLSLNLEGVSLSESFNIIKEKTDFSFIYDKEVVKRSTAVDLKIENQSLESVLLSLAASHHLSFKQVDNRISVKLVKKSIPEPAVSVETTLTGTVVDKAGQPIPGVTVSVLGSTKGTATDLDGKYQLSADEGSTLVFSFIGFVSQQILVGTQKIIDVTLAEDMASLEEVVVVGYGTIRKSDLTGSVSVLDAKTINTQIVNNVGDAVQGKVAGVSIESMGGAPGKEMRIQIRGAGSLTNNNPLILVDGVPVSSLRNISPSNIHSMQVLKDASAAAIYGSRAANGVILIETKLGKKGEIQFDVNIDHGVHSLAKKIAVLNADEWIMVNTAARAAAGLGPSDLALEPEVTGEGTNWQDEMYVTAPTTNYEVAARGGSETVNYNLAIGYLDQKGVVTQTAYDRLNLQARSEYTKGRLKLGANIFLSKEFQDQVASDGGGRGDVIESALLSSPATKIYQDERDLVALPNKMPGSGSNVIGLLHLHRNEQTMYNAFINNFLEYEILDGLKVKSNVSLKGDFSHYLYNRPSYADQTTYSMGTQTGNTNGELAENTSTSLFWQIENTVSYNKIFDDHSLNFVAGQSSQKSTYRNIGGSIFNLPKGITVLSAGSVNPSIYGTANESTLLSYFGRAIYSFRQKYILTATLRRDGSSKFSKENRYGYFPSIAAAWNAIGQDNYEAIKSPVSNLKFRGSYGVLGNQEIGNYQFLGTITPSHIYSIGEPAQLWTGSIQTSYPAVGVKWESTSTSNIGFDLGLWSGKFELTFDYFNRITSDVLLRVPVPLSVGVAEAPFGNSGEISNRGYEALAAYYYEKNEFAFSVTGTFSSIRNNVEKLSSGSQVLEGGKATLHGDVVNYTKQGYPIYSFFLLKTDGLFRSIEEVEAHSKDGQLIQPNAQPGDIRFVDQNNDGQIDGVDRVYSGSPFPDFEAGLRLDGNWKRFDLSVFFQGTYGNKIMNGFSTYLESVREGGNYSKKTLNSYTFNKDSDFPRLIITDPNRNGVDNSDRFLEDGSYLRVKTITLGYNVAENVIHRLSMSKARVYVGAQNLFTFTNYSGYNPEIGGGGQNGSSMAGRGVEFSVYPLTRSYHVGLQLNF